MTTRPYIYGMGDTERPTIPGVSDRDELTGEILRSAERLQELTSSGASPDGLELTQVLSDLIAAALPLWDSAMAIAALQGSTTVEIGGMAGITHQQVARRIATTPELEAYASQSGSAPRRVSRDGLAVARSDLQRGRLTYTGTTGAAKGRRLHA